MWTETTPNLCVSVQLSIRLYLAHHGLLVLLLLRDFDRRLLGHGRHQEVHQDVFAISHAVDRVQQAGRDVVGEQVVVVSDAHTHTHTHDRKERIVYLFIHFYQMRTFVLFCFVPFRPVPFSSAPVLLSRQRGSTRSLSPLLAPCQSLLSLAHTQADTHTRALSTFPSHLLTHFCCLALAFEILNNKRTKESHWAPWQ